MKTMKTKKYTHDEAFHNMAAPNIIVPIVLKTMLLPPPINAHYQVDSVVDFGCGVGTWLKAFKDNGVKEVLGLDGEWCNTDLLYKYIDKQHFKYVDLEMPITLDKAYDLVVSLEVAEHISEKSADAFVQSLVNAGKVVLFSAAIPGQGGDHHVNEQWPSYWQGKFGKHGYRFHDILRWKIWNHPDVDLWYKQNIFIVAHESVEIRDNDDYKKEIIDIVHPGYFTYVTQGLGVMRVAAMLKQSLTRALKRKLKT
jgi:SAM-dependent methyltransferase